MFVLQSGQVADDEDFGMAGDAEVGLDAERVRRGRPGRPSFRPSGDAATPAAHSTTWAGISFLANPDGARARCGSQHGGVNFDAQMFQLLLGLCAKVPRNRRPEPGDRLPAAGYGCWRG